MIKSAMITECWTPQSSHRDTFFLYIYILLYNVIMFVIQVVDVINRVCSLSHRSHHIVFELDTRKQKNMID